MFNWVFEERLGVVIGDDQRCLKNNRSFKNVLVIGTDTLGVNLLFVKFKSIQ